MTLFYLVSMLQKFIVSTQGKGDIVDITRKVEENLEEMKEKEGVVCVFVSGSTAAISATEYEPGVVKDIQQVLEEIAPFGADYRHHQRWGDQNGDAHIKSALIGPDMTVPVHQGELILGTWQQLILMDFDERERQREVWVRMIKDVS